MLLDHDWLPDEVDKWHDPAGVSWHVDYACPFAVGRLWEALAESIAREQWRRVGESAQFTGVAKGVDFTVPKRILKQARRRGDSRTACSVSLILQGHLFKLAELYETCPFCEGPMTLHHWLLECRPVLDRVEAHVDPKWEAFLREPGDQACFCRACPVPVGQTSQVALPSEDLVCTGVFEVWPVVTDGLFFGGDASGGPYTKDARIRKVSYAVAAVKWDDVSQAWACVGTMVADVDRLSQTVPYGEAAALRLCLQATVGDVVFATDASYVFQHARRLFAGGPSVATSHPTLWQDIWNDSSERCVKVLKVKSHLSKEAFLHKFGHEHLWMHKASAVADELCSDRANTMVHANTDIIHRWVDERARRLLLWQVAVLNSAQTAQKTQGCSWSEAGLFRVLI